MEKCIRKQSKLRTIQKGRLEMINGCLDYLKCHVAMTILHGLTMAIYGILQQSRVKSVIGDRFSKLFNNE